MMARYILLFLFSSMCSGLFAADIRIIVNSTSSSEIFGGELNDKKARKKIYRNLKKTPIKYLGCVEEGLLDENLKISGGTCFLQSRSCGYNDVNELRSYVQSFMNYAIVYVNCSSKFISERIPQGEAGVTWSDAIEKVSEMARNKNIENIFLVCIQGNYKSDLPEIQLELSSNEVTATCDECSSDGYYYWSVDDAKPKKTHSDQLLLKAGFNTVTCYWEDESGVCKSKTEKLNGRNKSSRSNGCRIENPNPAIRVDVKYQDKSGKINKLVSKDDVVDEEYGECWVINHTPHTGYYILLDSICFVTSIDLEIKDIDGGLVKKKNIDATRLFDQQIHRIEQRERFENGEETEDQGWKTELQVINQNKNCFLLMIEAPAFDSRFHEIFQLSATYHLKNGELIVTKPIKAHFNPCN